MIKPRNAVTGQYTSKKVAILLRFRWYRISRKTVDGATRLPGVLLVTAFLGVTIIRVRGCGCHRLLPRVATCVWWIAWSWASLALVGAFAADGETENTTKLVWNARAVRL